MHKYMIKKKNPHMLHFVALINANYDSYRLLYTYVWINKKNLQHSLIDTCSCNRLINSLESFGLNDKFFRIADFLVIIVQYSGRKSPNNF